MTATLKAASRRWKIGHRRGHRSDPSFWSESYESEQIQLGNRKFSSERNSSTRPKLARRHEILTSIAGVGTLTANQLIATMPELGSLDNKQAASLAGLAPVARQSGQWKGKSFIRGGRANVRQALYMPVLVAARLNPDLKAKYQQLVGTGKPAKIAITAVMRKLVVTANTLLKADRCWQQYIA
jgi:transposase